MLATNVALLNSNYITFYCYWICSKWVWFHKGIFFLFLIDRPLFIFSWFSLWGNIDSTSTLTWNAHFPLLVLIHSIYPTVTYDCEVTITSIVVRMTYFWCFQVYFLISSCCQLKRRKKKNLWGKTKAQSPYVILTPLPKSSTLKLKCDCHLNFSSEIDEKKLILQYFTEIMFTGPKTFGIQ